MKKQEVKAQAEAMAAQIFEYIDTALTDQKQKDDIYCELSASFLTCAIHDKNPDKAKKSISEKNIAIGAMCIAGNVLIVTKIVIMPIIIVLTAGRI